MITEDKRKKEREHVGWPGKINLKVSIMKNRSKIE